LVEVTRSPAAERDLVAILEYGASQWGSAEALAFVLSFEEACEMLAGHSQIGRARPELGTGIRSWLHRDYILYYRFDGKRVVVGRIMHGAVDAGLVDDWP